MGCCRAPIVTNPREEAEGMLVYGGSYDVQTKWFGFNHTADQRLAPVHVLVAAQGWFDQHFGSDVLFENPPNLARMPVPVMLEWEVVGDGAVPDTHSDPTRDCARRGRRQGYTCTCSYGYQGNPYLPDGCKGECQRFCGHIHVPHPFGIQGTAAGAAASCYMPGFNLTCDTTAHGVPRLLVGNNGFFRVIEFDLPNSALRVAHSGPILNISSHGPAFYFEGEGSDNGSEPRIFERREAPYSLSTRNELILMGCNAMATMYEDDGDQIAISGCTSVCPDNVTDNRYIDGVPRCYGTGCCQARISMSTNGMLPSLVSYEQIDKKRSPMPAYVLIAEAGWFDSQQNVSGKSRSVAAQDVPMILQWELLPLPDSPAPDAKSHPNCTHEVTTASN
ncbi:hypothetical protein ACQ4PT_014832 [Festuca glaucescens]